MTVRVPAEAVARDLAARYPYPRWAFAREVPSGTGGRRYRVADGIAYALWPSDRHEIDGFEIKVSRSDWLRELRRPYKAEEIAVYCHRWWLVVPTPDLVRPGELPAGWGVLTYDSTRRLRVHTRPAVRDPLPLPAGFVAGLVQAVLLRGPDARRPAGLPRGGTGDEGPAGRDACALASAIEGSGFAGRAGFDS